MVEERAKRKLTAILSADVKGYSRLMGEDELSTVETLKRYREIISSLVQQYSGRVVDSPGDNILAEFSSVVDAVECAVKIQGDLQEKNASLPENRRMEFRIGVNLGDVIDDEGRIYGNGVNVAARVEGLAEGGGICISRKAFNEVKNKISLGYENLGEHSVKNITEPVRVYKVLMEPEHAGKVIGEKTPKPKQWRWIAVATGFIILAGALAIWNFYFRPPPIEPASVEKMAFPLPEKPSIAVLPFSNLSGDPTQDYIADGISENIISALSKISEMLVIARNSTFTYKGKPVKVQQVSEELGVRYVMEGSTQKMGNRVRITAQLIDATKGHHLWSEKYDRDMKDLFALQDEIAHKIIVELQVKLTEGEQARVSHKSTTNLEAWSYAVRGLKLFERTSKENNAKAMELFERAVELDPNYVWAWVRLAWTHVVACKPGWSSSPSEHWKKVVEISEKVLVLDESDSDVHALLGLVYRDQHRYEEAIREGEISLVLGPTNAQAHVLHSVSMNTVGRFDDAIRLVKKAMRLHPYYPAYYLQWLGGAYRMTGRYEEALTVYNQLLDRSRKGEFPILGAHVYLADIYAELGKEDEARTHAAQVIKIKPEFSLKDVSKINTYRYKDPTHLERRLNALRKAGLPETPPLPLPDKPSIAVLPFVNMSDDPKQEYFSDGLTEEIITALSKTPKLFVIARTSSFKYKDKEVDVRTVGRELGVRYVLEGSVRKAGDKVRITAQLIDAKTNKHLWAERYDRDLKDIFAIQDEITVKIIAALQVKLTEGEQAHVFARGTKNVQAYLKSLEAREYAWQVSKDGIILARKALKEAIELDPGYGSLYAQMGWNHLMEVSYGWSKSPKKDLQMAYELAQKALALNADKVRVYMLLSGIHLRKGDIKETIALREKAIALEPNHAHYNGLLAIALTRGGRPEEAIEIFKKAIRLDPFPPVWLTHYLGTAYRVTDQYEKAIEAFKTAISRDRDFWLSHWVLAVCYGLLGREDEARASAAEVLRIRPNFSLAKVRGLPYKDKADKERCLAVLRKAGLK